jgi:inosose dehydratase
VRINFDTANIYYYNAGADAVAELRTILPYVEGVHLKDTRGGPQQFDFPTLGEGVVDFPGVFGLLNSRGFFGPFTMELEGTKGLDRDEAQIKQHVAESVAYLRRSGCID